MIELAMRRKAVKAAEASAAAARAEFDPSVTYYTLNDIAEAVGLSKAAVWARMQVIKPVKVPGFNGPAWRHGYTKAQAEEVFGEGVMQ